jgi:hypothetical protein
LKNLILFDILEGFELRDEKDNEREIENENEI